MATAEIHGLRLVGLASAVPAALGSVTEAVAEFGAEEIRKISESTGVEQRHVSTGRLCASDLCCAAARRLLGELNWDPESVEAAIFVSQCFDFVLPATSCTLHVRLGLSKDCAAFDVGMGCSGFVYGLWIAASLMAASGMSRVLLLVGDTIPRFCSPLDRSTTLLFGDAGSAAALEKNAAAQPFIFSLGTDGSGWRNLIIPAGASRRPSDEASAGKEKGDGENFRRAEDLFMDGAEMFAFALREVPSLINEVLAATQWNSQEVDYFVFHQANRLMLTHLAKFMKLPLSKVPLSLPEFGNTSSASIPVTINSKLADIIRSRSVRLVLAGFGVGYSWAGCSLQCGPMVAPEVVRVEETEAWQG